MADAKYTKQSVKINDPKIFWIISDPSNDPLTFFHSNFSPQTKIVLKKLG